MSQHEFDVVLQKYLAGTCTPAEEKIILDWYETFLAQTEVALSPDEKQLLEQKIWAKIRSNTLTGIDLRPAPVRLLNRPWIRIAAACLVLALLAGGYWYFKQPAANQYIQAFNRIKIPGDYKVSYNQGNLVQDITLSDGSIIELQPESSLYYPVRFTGTTRNVYLTGNAFFRVAHDTARHFIVHTDEGLLTEVLGTSFYVLHDKLTNKIEVTVVTGRVSVYEEKGKDGIKTVPESGKIILTPNQKVSFKPLNNQFITSLVEDPKPVELPAGNQPKISFVFEEAALFKVLEDLETSYGISIQTENDNINNCHFTGDISRQSLYDKLDIICKSTQSSYEIRGTVIYMRGKGCN